jgi:hypothetical protein
MRNAKITISFATIREEDSIILMYENALVLMPASKFSEAIS